MEAPSEVLRALQRLAEVAREVTRPDSAAPARRSCRCCSGRFEDPALIRRAVDAAEQLDFDTLESACARAAAVRREALRLTTELLPAALQLNFSPFMDLSATGCFARDLALPETLFFTFLQAQHDVSEALVDHLRDADRYRLLRAVVPVWSGCMAASSAGYGFEYLLQKGKLGPDPIGTWEHAGGDYGSLFFVKEVEDAEVLALLRQHNLDFGIQAWADGAKEAGDTDLCTNWVRRL